MYLRYSSSVGRADAVKLAARQHRLEHVARVHRPLGLARADHGVDLVDEKDDLPGRLGHLLEHRLEPLLEFAPVLRAGDERAQVERDDLLVLQAVGHVPRHDPLGQPLHDGGLAHARLADQDVLFLVRAGENLNGAADLTVAADDRIELVLPRQGGQVAAVFLERLVGRLGDSGWSPAGCRAPPAGR